MKTDKALEYDVTEELTWEPSVGSTHIGVAAHGGVITLTGHVPHSAQKWAAEDAAKRVYEVLGVANDIRVIAGEQKRDDPEIAAAAVHALRWDTLVTDDIQVGVRGGWVTLAGRVEWQYQKEAAERAVRNLAGVMNLTKSLQVRPRVRAEDVKEKIAASFRQHADLDAKRVETTDGKVILRGSVRPRTERDDAARAAWAAPGCRK
jgi:osmotically-inducible protein OsmY